DRRVHRTVPAVSGGESGKLISIPCRLEGTAVSLPATPRSAVSSPLPRARSASSPTRSSRLVRSLRRNYFYYLLALPGLLYFLVFEYGPIVLGVMIAFKDISPFDGFEGVISEPNVGFANFQRF